MNTAAGDSSVWKQLAEELAYYLDAAELVPVQTKTPRALPQTASVAPVSREVAAPAAVPALSSASDSRLTMDWEALKAEANVCQRCRLAQTRQNVVFGVGNCQEPLVAFVGEGPGAEEDKKGEPFVGRAGELLTAAITKGMGLKRADVYIWVPDQNKWVKNVKTS